MMSAVFILAALFLTKYWLRPPAALRGIAYANLLLFTLFSIGFSLMTGAASRGVDALKFFRRGVERDLSGVEVVAQADFMYLISGTLQRFLPIDYMAFNLLGALGFSYVGLLFLMRMTPQPSQRIIFVWWVVTLLPGFHFWNASFGKDSLQLLVIGMFFYYKSFPFKGAALLVLLFVRPHIALVLAFCEVVSTLLTRGLSLRKVFILVGGAGVALFAVDYLVNRLGGSGISLSVLVNLLSEYGGEWREGTYRNSDTSSPLALLEFSLRPYLWEAADLQALVFSLDSIVLTVLGAYVIFSAPGYVKRQAAWLFAILVFGLLAVTNPNMGTALRKKQLLPFAILAVSATFAARPRRRETEIPDYVQAVPFHVTPRS